MAEQENGRIKSALKRVARIIRETAGRIFAGKPGETPEEELRKKQEALEKKISSLKGMIEEAPAKPKKPTTARRQEKEFELGIVAEIPNGEEAAEAEKTKTELPRAEKAPKMPKPEAPAWLATRPFGEKKEGKQMPKIGRMIETAKKGEEEKQKIELEKKLRRHRAAKKGARKRKKKHEEIVERLEKIEKHVRAVPRISQKPLAEKEIVKKLKKIEKNLKRGKRGEKKTSQISWSAGQEMVKTLKKIEKKTKPIKARLLQVPKEAKVSVGAGQKTEKRLSKTEAAPVEREIIERLPELAHAEKLSLDEQIELTKRMVNRVRYEYFKRLISEEEFKKRTTFLEERLRLLEEKKKILAERKPGSAEKAEPAAAPKKAFAPLPQEPAAIAKAGAAQKAVPAKTESIIQKVVEEKAAGQIPKEKIKDIESRLIELAAKYNIPKKEMALDIEKLGSNKILEDFDKLINMIERQYNEKNRLEQRETMKFEAIPAHIAQKHRPPRESAVEMEITKQTLETDFDRIADFVKKVGTCTVAQIARELKISGGGVKEGCRILEQNGLLRVEYPAIGDVRIIDIEYSKNHRKEEEKLKAEAAKQQAPEQKKPGFFKKIRLFGAKKQNEQQGDKNA